MERIPLDTVAYKVVEDIRDYSQLGGLKKEQDRLQQQIYMFNAFMANKQAVLMSLMRLQCMGINEDQIHGMNRSNAIALGVLVQYFKMDFFKALELIQSRVPICTIISTNIVALTKLFNV